MVSYKASEKIFFLCSHHFRFSSVMAKLCYRKFLSNRILWQMFYHQVILIHKNQRLFLKEDGSDELFSRLVWSSVSLQYYCFEEWFCLHYNEKWWRLGRTDEILSFDWTNLITYFGGLKKRGKRERFLIWFFFFFTFDFFILL